MVFKIFQILKINTLFICGWSLFAISANAQYNKKTVEAENGTFVYCYHKNGKISTEEFHSNSMQYMAGGYARAYDSKGTEIYYMGTSRSGLISSVNFSYYESGAIKKAEYNSHPDAGIQWYQKVTEFDEDGKVVRESEMRDDYTVTVSLPDTLYHRLLKEEEERQRQKEAERLKQEKENERADSANFFINEKVVLDDKNIQEFKPNAEDGYREITIKSAKGKLISYTLEYYKRNDGVIKIVRIYYKNGRVHEEYIYEKLVWHHRVYSKKGILISEKLNQSGQHP
ncbi:MAG: hypothetical protein IPM74_15445 [Crocinitomicaceae bacterium]|nr:hypothetical protein [Crocinitomicaceae bacterium]